MFESLRIFWLQNTHALGPNLLSGGGQGMWDPALPWPLHSLAWIRHLLFMVPSVKYEESLCHCELTAVTGVKMLGVTCWRPKFASWNTGHKLNYELNQLILYRHPQEILP